MARAENPPIRTERIFDFIRISGRDLWMYAREGRAKLRWLLLEWIRRSEGGLLEHIFRRYCALTGRPNPFSDDDAKRPIPYGSLVTYGGITLRIDERYSPRQALRIANGRHTKEERLLVLSCLDQDDTVMELGGGIGMLSAACAKRIGSERVFSFEANRKLAPIVEETYSLNGVRPSMQYCVLGEQAGTQTFFVTSNFSQSSLLRRNDFTKPEEMEVEMRAFNDEVALIRPSFLVVDIEGGEDELLRFASLEGIRKVVIEMHPVLLGARRCNALRRMLRKRFREVRRKDQVFLYLR